MLLEIENLQVEYGGAPALRSVSLSIDEGQFVSVVGPNGAGKTTLFKTLSGIVPATRGSITFGGRDLLSVAPWDRPHLGIAHVPEGRQVFGGMSVYENLLMGAYTQAGQRHWVTTLEQIFSLFPILKERRDQPAGTLSGGQQQMVAIGRGLASSPRLLMLDEPSMGLAPVVVDEIFESLQVLHRQHGMTILLVEQRVAEALETADNAYVLDTGMIVSEGAPTALLQDQSIRQAYLGF